MFVLSITCPTDHRVKGIRVSPPLTQLKAQEINYSNDYKLTECDYTQTQQFF